MVWVRVSVAVNFPLVPVDGEDQPLSSVLGIEGIQAPNHTFPLGSCSSILSSSFG